MVWMPPSKPWNCFLNLKIEIKVLEFSYNFLHKSFVQLRIYSTYVFQVLFMYQIFTKYLAIPIKPIICETFKILKRKTYIPRECQQPSVHLLGHHQPWTYSTSPIMLSYKIQQLWPCLLSGFSSVWPTKYDLFRVVTELQDS